MSAEEVIKLVVKSLTGTCYNVEVPRDKTILDVKKAVEAVDPRLFTFIQRLVEPGSGQEILSDDAKLSNYSNGTTLNLVISPFNVYIQGRAARQYTVLIPSSKPESYLVSDLYSLIEKKLGHSISDCQLLHQGKVRVDSMKGAQKMCLMDYSIKPESTLIVTKKGLELDVTNPTVDICFLVDCTSSMRQHILAVKSNIQQLRDRLVKEYNGSDLAFSFVRYTDYDQPKETKTTFLQFTSNPADFREFVSKIKADGGGDVPEDIMGGLKVAFGKLVWRRESCKILIHIADAPCHGKQYHQRKDSYPDGDPAGITHDAMMKEVVKLNIQYWFGYVYKLSTDQMIQIFNESLKKHSNNCLLIRQFDAMNCNEIGAAVERNVIASVYARAAANDATDPREPDWNDFSITKRIAKITPFKLMMFADILDDDFELCVPCDEFEFKIAPTPFARGSKYFVFYGSDLINLKIVMLKKFKQSDLNDLNCYMAALKSRTLSLAYAHEFVTDENFPESACLIEFVSMNIIQTDDGYFVLEPYIKDFEKGNTESIRYTELFEAFSHYSWVKSDNTLLISGLQGSKRKREKIVLIDSVVYSNNEEGKKYGSKDLGIKGVHMFFDTHSCSNICKQMGLGDKRM